ncbi:MAG TPA: BamA/TamA family outer membrane protein [Burkholderiaceae bacterium]|nr:BamA/TamA family outer membrane protein [Burkholderiaceae bacterium]
MHSWLRAAPLAILLTATAPLSPVALAQDTPAATVTPPKRVPGQVEIDAPSELRDLLNRHLDVVRLLQAGAPGDLEFNRLLLAAPAQVRALLETEGYFAPVIEVSRASGDTPARIKVLPGPRVQVGAVQITAAGPLGEALKQPAADPSLGVLWRRVTAAWPLPVGSAFRVSDWNGAKAAVLSRLRAERFPNATLVSSEAEINAEDHRALLRVELDSGPAMVFGQIRVEGLSRYPESSVLNLKTFGPGTVYSEKLLLDYQERLIKTGQFGGVSVSTEAADASGQLDVIVRVQEQSAQQLTLSVGFDDAAGPRVGAEHVSRRVFGSDWTAKAVAQLGKNKQDLSTDFYSYPGENLYRWLVGVKRTRLVAGGQVTVDTSARLGRTRDTERIERTYYAEVLHATALDRDSGQRGTASAYSANYFWVHRDVDSVLLPTRGLTTSAQLTTGFASSSFADNGPFTRLNARMTYYRPLGSRGNRWYAIGRVEAGSVFARTEVALPESVLFRTGGDQSVRGYNYQSLGVQRTDPQGKVVVTGGRYLATASAELARPISEKLSNFWVAGFVDAGNAGDTLRGLNPALGYGLGLRWRSPVGPLNVDLAYGDRTRKWRLHLTVGVAF